MHRQDRQNMSVAIVFRKNFFIAGLQNFGPSRVSPWPGGWSKWGLHLFIHTYQVIKSILRLPK